MKDPVDIVTGELDGVQTQVIASQPAAFKATIHITRAATGQTETYEIVGTPLKDTPCQ